MVYEIQKSFLLANDCIVSNLQRDGIQFQSVDISVFYTQISSQKRVKFQSIGEKYFKIILAENEFLEQDKKEISQKVFLKEQKNALTPVLKKKSLEFKFCSLKSYIELYENPKLCVLKIFFETLKDAENFSIPRDFKVLKEINLDSKILSLYGYNLHTFDIEKCFKIIEKNQNFTLEFPDAIGAFDGFRIFLFYLFRKLKFYWNLCLENKQKDDLYEFYLYTQKIFIILSSFDEVFDKNLSELLALKFKNLAEKSSLILESKDQEDSLLLALSSKELNDLFNDFDIFIKESSFYQGLQKDVFFKQLVAFEFRKKLILFKKFLIKDFEYEEFAFKFMQISVFLEYFKSLFNLKSLNKLSDKYFLNSQKKSFSKIMKKRKKVLKWIDISSKNLRIYKG
ncbi:hypothetical protein [Campylobacter cuniculorum]|uniref:CYTH-like family protein n=2 Tax=Campylobacter cuniculorum TaxID=374106 RepID=A0A1W6BZ58_9BACT|nr:hypothetical protein [Campylobacter cuniculorum]ARJ57362.1 CYTH-like family protein [Campylobacter cuniculorum DSM 23162 = LMG 24588]QOR04798.1 hypothetical protein A0071_02300 [Campylobacter cuniculorum]